MFEFGDGVMMSSMQINPYLSFNGNCEEAFNFYAQCLGGQVSALFRYGESPMASDVPPERANKVMHATLTCGDQVVMGGDPPGPYEAPKGFSLSINVTGEQEAERIFGDLAKGGAIVMPLEKTFWAARFGMLVDRFGIPWMINCDAAAK